MQAVLASVGLGMLLGFGSPGDEEAARATDGVLLPTADSGPVIAPRSGASQTLVGHAAAISRAPFSDRQRRLPWTRRPVDFGHMLQPGETFRYDVRLAGNPVGLAEAQVVRRAAGPHARDDRVALRARAQTSGVVALVTSMVDEMQVWVDARTGAPLVHENLVERTGWLRGRYRRRVTVATFEGRGQVRLVDVKDARVESEVRRVPRDTLDALSMLAWLRALELEVGESIRVHVVDGTVLHRIEVERGHTAARPDVPIATALGVDAVIELQARIVRVDAYDQPRLEHEPRSMRIWLSADPRRIPLLLETDVWFGALRLTLSGYDPPSSPGSQSR